MRIHKHICGFYEYGYSICYYYKGELELYNDEGELLSAPKPISGLFEDYFYDTFPTAEATIRMELGKNLLKFWLKNKTIL